MHRFNFVLIACAASATIGVTLFVGMTLAVYYDYTIGMDFYLGGENRFLVAPAVYFGLILSVTAGLIALVAGVHMAIATLRLPRKG